LLALAAREWWQVYSKGQRPTAAALLAGDAFIGVVAALRLAETVREEEDPTDTSMAVWHLGLAFAAVQYALSRGWFLKEQQNKE
jgi:hypothetical protein